MKEVFVIGLESSGRNWVQSVLNQHPCLYVGGDSIPTGGYELRTYPDIPDNAILVVVARDHTAHRASVNLRGYEKGNEGKFTDEESLHVIGAAISRAPSTVFVSYETALVYRQTYWDWVFRLLSVDSIPVKTEYLDGNRKYFNAGRYGVV